MAYKLGPGACIHNDVKVWLHEGDYIMQYNQASIQIYGKQTGDDGGLNGIIAGWNNYAPPLKLLPRIYIHLAHKQPPFCPTSETSDDI